MASGSGGEVEFESTSKNTTGQETPYFSTCRIGDSTESSRCGHCDMSEQYGDKKEETIAKSNRSGQHQGSDFQEFRDNALKVDEESVDNERTSAFGNKCSNFCWSSQSHVNDEKVDKQGMQTEHVSNGNTSLNLRHDLNCAVVEFDEISEYKIGAGKTCENHLKAFDCHSKAIKISQMLHKQGVVIKGHRNAYSKIGQYDKTIYSHGRHSKTAEKLGEKGGVGRYCNNLGNAYNICQCENTLDCKRESVKNDFGDKEGVGTRIQSEIVEELEDKQTVKRISRNIENYQYILPVNCKCSLILENSSYNLDIVERFQQPLVMSDCDFELHSLKQPLMGNNTVVILIEPRTHDIAIVSYTAPIVMVTFQKCINAESDGLAEKHENCVCRKVFAAIENVLRGGTVEICTVKTCQENNLNKHSGDTRVSTDAEIIDEIETLATEMSLSKERMTEKLVADILQPEADESAAKSISLVNQKEAISSRELVDMRHKHQEMTRQLLKIKEKVRGHRNALALAGETKKKAIKADAAVLGRETRDVCLTFSQDPEISETTETTSGVQQQIETATSSEETATSSEETATSSEENVTSSEENVTSSEETATSSEETATSSEETAISSEETAISSEETVTSSEETATSSEETAASSEETATTSEETATTLEGSATTSEDESEERYPVARLQLYFSRHLLEQDWFGLRRVICGTPKNALSSIPNDVSLFEELVKRNLINDQNMDLLREALYEIKRIDCVHFIDCSKYGEYLTEFENVEDREGVANMNQQNNHSVSAVHDVRGISDERSHQPAGASGFQTPVDVKDGAERIVGSDVCERLSTTRNKDGAQWDKRDIQGKYTNSPPKSLTVPVQEVVPGENLFLPGCNGMNSRHRNEDAAAQSEVRSRNRDESSQGGVIQAERCNAGSHTGEIHETGSWNEVSLKTGSNKTGSYKTGSSKTVSSKTGSSNTGSSNTSKTGNSEAGSSKTGSQKTGSKNTGSHKTGNFETGTSKTGNSEAGSSKTGSSRDASGRDGSTWREGEEGKGNMKRANDVKWSCGHYERYCDVQFDCCEEFWPCHRCHNAESKCEEKKLRSRDITKIKCKRCSTVQEFPKENPNCIECGLKFSEYFCAPCQHLTGRENHPFHCEGCGICRINEDRSFHCDVCGVCLDVNLLENHICRPDSAHDQCCICFEDAFNGCQILPCSHKIHKDCARMMLNNGITTCPVCRQSFAHKLQHRPLIPK